MLHPESPRGARLTALLVLVVAFGAGAVAGASVDRLFTPSDAGAEATDADQDGATDRPDDDDDDDDGDRDRRRRSRVLDEVALTDAQSARIDTIRHRWQEQVETIWNATGSELRALSDSARADIRAVLTPMQREEYDRLLEERRRARRERERNRDGNDDDQARNVDGQRPEKAAARHDKRGAADSAAEDADRDADRDRHDHLRDKDDRLDLRSLRDRLRDR